MTREGQQITEQLSCEFRCDTRDTQVTDLFYNFWSTVGYFFHELNLVSVLSK